MISKYIKGSKNNIVRTLYIFLGKFPSIAVYNGCHIA